MEKIKKSIVFELKQAQKKWGTKSEGLGKWLADLTWNASEGL